MLHTPPAQQSWIAYRKSLGQQPRLRLFCIPYAGGSASVYRQWHKFLPGIEVCPIQLPGRENRLQEQTFTHISQILEPLAKGILPLLDVPFAFFGHSMGALISFELAHFVQSHYGYTPQQLFFSACRASHISRADLPVLHHLSDADFISGVKQLGGMQEDILQNKEMMELILPTLRADFTICETYIYKEKPLFTCPITSLGGRADKEVTQQHLLSWHKQTCGSFHFQEFAGNHFFLNTEQDALFPFLTSALERYLPPPA